MGIILFCKLLPTGVIMLLDSVKVRSSAGPEPLVWDLGPVSTLFATHPHLSIVLEPLTNFSHSASHHEA